MPDQQSPADAGGRLDNHPIRELFDAGVTVTLSTDDPIMFGNTVSAEYVALAERRGFARRELVQLARNGFPRGSPARGEKRRYCAELDAIEAGLSANAPLTRQS